MPQNTEELLQQTFAVMSTDKLSVRVRDPALTALAKKLAQEELDRRHPMDSTLAPTRTNERLRAFYTKMSTSKLSARAQDPELTALARKIAQEELDWRKKQGPTQFVEDDTEKERRAKPLLFMSCVGLLVIAIFVMELTGHDGIWFAGCAIIFAVLIFARLFPITSRWLAFVLPLFATGLIWKYWHYLRDSSGNGIVFWGLNYLLALYAAYLMYTNSFDDRSYSEFLADMKERAEVLGQRSEE